MASNVIEFRRKVPDMPPEPEGEDTLLHDLERVNAMVSSGEVTVANATYLLSYTEAKKALQSSPVLQKQHEQLLNALKSQGLQF